MKQLSISSECFTCAYPGSAQPALEKISINVQPEHLVAVVGPSGCGKSTLCLAINGIIPHEVRGCSIGGRMIVAGRDTTNTSPQDLVVHVGTVLQDPDWQMTFPVVEEEIAFGLENLGVHPNDIDFRIGAALACIDAVELRYRHTAELSGGERQRIALAAALAMRPSILVLDEPLAELDPAGKYALIDAIRSMMRRTPMTVILIEHNVEIVVPIADQVIVLREGRVAFSGSPRRLLEHVADEFLGDFCPVISKVFALAFPKSSPPLTLEEASQQIAPIARCTVTEDLPTAGQRPNIVSLESVSFRYPHANHVAIRNTSLAIRQGESVAFLGRNGSGKSTLGRLLARLISPTTGRLLIGDAYAEKMSRTTISSQVAYVFQSPDYQLFQRTVYDEIAFGLQLRGHSKERIDECVIRTAESLRIANFLHEHPHFLSRGQRKRVAIASVLVLEPRLLILDEPTIGLDAASRFHMLSTLLDLQRRDITTLVITHEVEFALQVSQRAIVLDQGSIVDDGYPSRVLSIQSLKDQTAFPLPPFIRLCMANGMPLTSDPHILVKRLASSL